MEIRTWGYLTKALADNKTITWLDLRNNAIGVKCLRNVEQLLKLNLNVTRVDIMEQVCAVQANRRLPFG